MKKTNKILALVLAVILIVGIAVAGTVAYLTSTPAAVTNTFTVGQITITLDETDYDEYGQVLDPAPTAPVYTNAYILIPGQEYKKDPTVHVAADSEKCYVFIKVVNGLSSVEAASAGDKKNIADQIAVNWTALGGTGNDGVYYKVVEKDATNPTNINVFSYFIIDGSKTATDLAAVTDVTIKAYAIQYAGFETDAAGAWTAVKTAAGE